jgi:flagellar hook-associated protein 2
LIDTAEGAGVLSVKDIGSGKSARDLGLLSGVQEVEIDGDLTKVISGSTSYTVEIDADDSLQDLITKINGLGAAVNASSLQDGSGATPYRLSLSSQVPGKAGALQIDASQTSLSFFEIASAQDALLLVGSADSSGIIAASSNNQFDNLFDGVSLKVGAADGQTVTISVAATDSSIISTVKTFVDSYNALRKSLATFTVFNEADQTVGVLFGSNEALRVDAELSDLVSGRFAAGGDIRSLAEVGVSINDDGTLTFDSAKLSEAFAANPEAVEQFFTSETSGMATRMTSLIETLAGAGSSLLVNRAGSLAQKIEINNERIVFQNRRLEKERERLLKYFYNLELSIGKLQSNIDAISQIQPIPPLYSTQQSR